MNRSIRMPFQSTLIVLLLLFFCSSRRPSQATWEETCSKDGLLCWKATKRPFTGVLVSKGPNGSIKSKTSYLEGVIDGTSYSWHENGKKESEADWHKGVSSGRLIKWNRNGLIFSEVLFSGNDIRGVVFYYSTGELWSCTIYSLDGRMAHVIQFDREGHIIADGIFDRTQNRKVSGSFCNTDYDVLVIEKYSEGEPVGTVDKNGNPLDVGQLRKNDYNGVDDIDARTELSEKLFGG